MQKEKIIVYCGEGKGKTSAALGRGLQAADKGKSVIVIQFLKGRRGTNLEIVKRIEPEMKVFRFEKYPINFNELSAEQQAEETANTKNAFNFAKKVLVTGECDLLILDEVLGLVDLGLITEDDLEQLLVSKSDSTGLVITGIHIKKELLSCVDEVYEISSLKSER